MFTYYPYQNLSLSDLAGEIWKDIPGYETCYQISNMGRIKSLSRREPITGIRKEKIIQQTVQNIKGSQLLCFGACMDGKMKGLSVSRSVYSAFIEPLPDFKKQRLMILHKDEDNLNNRVENLLLLTHSQMSKYYTALGRIGPPWSLYIDPLCASLNCPP